MNSEINSDHPTATCEHALAAVALKQSVEQLSQLVGGRSALVAVTVNYPVYASANPPAKPRLAPRAAAAPASVA